MGDRGADDPASTTWRTQAFGEGARGAKRIFYILWTGCQWRALPKDLPPKSTVHDYLELWNWDGTPRIQLVEDDPRTALRITIDGRGVPTCPPRRGNSLSIEVACNFSRRPAGGISSEDPANDLGLFSSPR